MEIENHSEKDKPLLSICIPTYNRGNILKIAFDKLLPQVNIYNKIIELVISDNASSDNTQVIIKKYQKLYPKINWVTFLQSENTGYYGNFKKCRELSTGKYFWLLSDNDHINNGVINEVIKVLSLKEKKLGVVYLHSINNMTGYYKKELFFEEIKEKHKEYALMLISSVLVFNDKTQDYEIFEKFKNNDFLGFIFFIKALEYSKKMIVIEGSIFSQYPTTVTFNIFKSWIEDIMECVNYLRGKNLVTTETIKDLVNGFLARVIVHHVHRYVAYGNILGKKYGSIKELRTRLDSVYSDYEYYVNVIRPIFFKNRKVLLTKDLIKRAIKKLKEY